MDLHLYLFHFDQGISLHVHILIQPFNQDQQPFLLYSYPDYLVTNMFVNSYEAVGWIPIVESNWYLVSPILIATA
jgi:hypothetical protein